ncbi:MAG: response regulator transcription factor [Burkholderiales bacterium]|nr:response regulator transcription factor [Burkholderiales bacterium]
MRENTVSPLQETQPARILVVEDDPGLRILLVRTLRENGFDAIGASAAPEMWQAVGAAPVDLILLDIMLPGTSGLDLCRMLRRDSEVRIIMVSARGEETDRVVGLELGADDYIAKPFGTKELLARVRAVLRRGPSDRTDQASRQETVQFAGWSLDLRRRELVSPAGAEVDLSGAEYDLLVSFVANPQRVIGRERLLELSRTRLGDVSDRSVDVLVSRLRRKLSGGQRGGSLIRTIRGVGYMFTADVQR